MSRLWLRIFGTVFLALMLFSAGAAAISWWGFAQRAEALQEARRSLQAEAQAIGLRGGREALREWLARTVAADPRRRVLLVGDDGYELLTGRDVGDRLGELREPRAPRPPRIALAPPPRDPRPAWIVLADGERWRLFVQPRPPARLGPLALPDIRGAAIALALAVAALLSAWLARSITRPIADLERATQALAEGRLEARVSVTTTRRRDEIGRLGGAFDAMAVRLEQLVRTREQLLRDVSHELRSPLARMRVAVGLAERTDTDRALQHARITEEITRLDKLLGTILDVSRLAAGADALKREPLDLLALLDQIAGDARFEAAALGKQVDWRPPPQPVTLLGDPQWLAAAIENLVRNAIRHTPGGSTVQLALRVEAESAIIAVEDAGPGVEPAALTRIFEPFYRVEAGRERDGSSSGTGLGLAIAERVVRAHGGDIVARARQPNGLTIEVRLPMRAPAPS